VATEHERDAKAEPGKLARPDSYAAELAHGSGVLRAQLPAVREALAAWNVTIRPATPICSPPNSWPTPQNTPAARQGSPAKPPTPRWTCPATAGQTHVGRGRGMAIVTARAIASGARAEPSGKTAWFTRRATASAVLPAVTGVPEPLSHPRNTPLANLMVSAGPAQALSGCAPPRKDHADHD
jgi:hypothetical protein